MKRFGYALAAALLALAAPAVAQDFPTKPITLIVPYSAGGPTDVRARLVAEEMGKILGQNVLVENKTGAGTIAGTQAALQAPPDGYTLLFHSTAMALAPLTYKDAGYTLDDIALLAPLGVAPHVLAAHPDVPFNNPKELVEYAKANPGAINAGSLGGGGTALLLTERLKDAAGIEMTEVRYAGSGPALAAVMSGEIDVFMDSLTSSVPPSREGRAKLIGVTSPQRLASVPDVPTFAEFGFETAVGGTWMGVFSPAKVPADIRAKLRDAAVKAIALPSIQEKIGVLGFEMWAGTPEEFEAFMKKDFDLWAADIKRIGLELQ